ncbi:MAG TPA: NifB/NifX family molybdenum-iron cluster-binding protein [Candidatus Atribacteria bacterium]|jgi:predicted Fe-Mo cluster-binding NifX family protein|nr:dinitrogenase iron-molybdenum cofactor biosynthesis protein [bacterium]HOQ67608.1 NifB/NifX family molybdenum-iron cluster-binding protein [Candidatus Atribacteria bacterium]
MKIGITAKGDNLDSEVDPRFGRCKYFIIVDPDTLEFEAIENFSIEASGGAGVQSGQLVATKEVEVILTGNIGPNAFQILQSAGIKTITGASGKVREAIEKYKKGGFKPVEGSNVNSKFGVLEEKNRR